MTATLISAPELYANLTDPNVRMVDCRFDLAAPMAGEEAYRVSHVPGAVYAHLDHYLSGPPVTDNGRHPLPSPARLRDVFGRLGIRANTTEVVAYDAAGGGFAAARLWWLLRYLGHERVRVLDGGWQRWLAGMYPIAAGIQPSAATDFHGEPRQARVVALAEVPTIAQLVDAREPRRYRGDIEPIDPRAGHIPGARNHFWQHNLDADGCFLAPEALREAFQQSLGTLPTTATVFYCGSGVSACHNVLAQVHAGLPEPRVYCGSWSEWCRSPTRPAAIGAD